MLVWPPQLAQAGVRLTRDAPDPGGGASWLKRSNVRWNSLARLAATTPTGELRDDPRELRKPDGELQRHRPDWQPGYGGPGRPGCILQNYRPGHLTREAELSCWCLARDFADSAWRQFRPAPLLQPGSCQLRWGSYRGAGIRRRLHATDSVATSCDGFAATQGFTAGLGRRFPPQAAIRRKMTARPGFLLSLTRGFAKTRNYERAADLAATVFIQPGQISSRTDFIKRPGFIGFHTEQYRFLLGFAAKADWGFGCGFADLAASFAVRLQQMAAA